MRRPQEFRSGSAGPAGAGSTRGRPGGGSPREKGGSPALALTPARTSGPGSAALRPLGFKGKAWEARRGQSRMLGPESGAGGGEDA